MAKFYKSYDSMTSFAAAAAAAVKGECRATSVSSERSLRKLKVTEEWRKMLRKMNHRLTAVFVRRLTTEIAKLPPESLPKPPQGVPLFASDAPYVNMPTVEWQGKKYTRMAVGYTETANLVLQPWVYDFKTCYFFRYMIYAFFMIQPLIWWINGKVNSPEAKKAWAEKKRIDEEKEHRKKDPYYDFIHGHKH